MEFHEHPSHSSSNSDKSLILAIDQSTTTTKINIYNTKSENLFSEMKPHEQITPYSGWLEHDPLEILENLDKIAETAAVTVDISQIKCIGVTNQRETVVAWNKNTGKPYYNAIVWSDARTLEITEKVLSNHKNDKECFKHITGLPVSTYFTAFKIKWLFENIPAISQDIDDVLFGTIDSWLIWNLTGEHVTDVTNASRTFLMDLQTLSWCPELLEEFKIPLKSLPKILDNCDDFGTIQKGPLKGIPITGCLGDQHAAALGQGLFEKGQAKNTYGTGSFLIVNVGERVAHIPGLISTVCYKLGKDQNAVYALEGSIETGGNTINWLRDKMGLFSTWQELEELVGQITDNGGVYFVPAFSGLYCPEWNETATGTIIGLTAYAGKSHIMRACLEAISYRTKDVVKCIEENSSIEIQKLNVDGGVTVNEFFMQFQADLLQKSIERLSIKEATCFGTAVAAGLHAGLFKSLDEIKKLLVYEKKVNFDTNKKELMESNYSNWLSAVKRSLNWKGTA